MQYLKTMPFYYDSHVYGSGIWAGHSWLVNRGHSVNSTGREREKTASLPLLHRDCQKARPSMEYPGNPASNMTAQGSQGVLRGPARSLKAL